MGLVLELGGLVGGEVGVALKNPAAGVLCIAGQTTVVPGPVLPGVGKFVGQTPPVCQGAGIYPDGWT